MSALPRHSAELGYAGLLMTAEEFAALDETRERYELVHGVVCMSPPGDPAHGDAVSEVIQSLKNFGARVFTEIDLNISGETVYRPDVCAYKPGRVRGRVRTLPPWPDLVIEALSPSTKAFDLVTKRADYDRAGIGEYWIIDPETLLIRVWRRRDGTLTEEVGQGDQVTSRTIPGFVFDVRPLRNLFDEQ